MIHESVASTREGMAEERECPSLHRYLYPVQVPVVACLTPHPRLIAMTMAAAAAAPTAKKAASLTTIPSFLPLPATCTDSDPPPAGVADSAACLLPAITCFAACFATCAMSAASGTRTAALLAADEPGPSCPIPFSGDVLGVIWRFSPGLLPPLRWRRSIDELGREVEVVELRCCCPSSSHRF